MSTGRDYRLCGVPNGGEASWCLRGVKIAVEGRTSETNYSANIGNWDTEQTVQ